MAFAADAGAAMHDARLYGRLIRKHTRLQQVHTIGRKGLKLELLPEPALPLVPGGSSIPDAGDDLPPVEHPRQGDASR